MALSLLVRWFGSFSRNLEGLGLGFESHVARPQLYDRSLVDRTVSLDGWTSGRAFLHHRLLVHCMSWAASFATTLVGKG